MARRLGDAASEIGRRRIPQLVAVPDLGDSRTPPVGNPEVPDRLPVNVIAPHPLNPRGRVTGGVDELAASMVQLGLIEPVVVASREVFLAARPSLADQLPDDAEWVLIAGERRVAAAVLAGLSHVKAISGGRFMQEGIDLQTMVAENVERVGLTVLQEASAYASMIADGLSQRTVARAVSRNQSHVARRLRLLRLPQDAQSAIEQGELAISDALELANADNGNGNADDELIAAAWLHKKQRTWLKISFAIEEAIRERTASQVRAQAQLQARTDGIPLIEEAELPAGKPRQLREDAAIETARQDGTLTAVATKTGLQYVDSVDLKAAATPPTDRAAERAAQQKGVTKVRNAARKARREAAGRAVRTPPKVTELLDAVIDYAIETSNFDARKAAASLLGFEGDAYAWIASLTDQASRRRAAWSLTITHQEVRISPEWRTWGPQDATYLQLLTAHGYDITNADREATPLKSVTDGYNGHAGDE